ncbi:hypothetical protein KR074_008465, partial [Drosophila pseudoananassae]
MMCSMCSNSNCDSISISNSNRHSGTAIHGTTFSRPKSSTNYCTRSLISSRNNTNTAATASHGKSNNIVQRT